MQRFTSTILLLVGILQLLSPTWDSYIFSDHYIKDGNKEYRKGNYKEALKLYGRARSACEEVDKALNNQALVYAQYGRYHLGIKKLNAAIDSNAANGNYYYNRALHHVAMQEPDLALADFEEAESLGVSLSNDKLYHYAYALYQKCRYDDVNDLIHNSTIQSDNKSNIYYLNGLAYFQQKEYSEAAYQFELAYDTKKDLKYSYAKAMASHYAGELDTDLQELLSGNGSKEEKLNLYNALGNIALGSENENEAMIAFEKALDVSKNSSYAWSGMGIVAMNNNQTEEAIALFQKAVAMDRNNVQALNSLGRIANVHKKYNKAISFYDRAIKIQPSNYMAMYGCAYAHMRKVDPFSCLDYIGRIEKDNLSPTQFEKIILLEAYAMSKCNRIGESILLIQKHKHQLIDEQAWRTHLGYYSLKGGQLQKVHAIIGNIEYESFLPYLIAGNALLQVKKHDAAYQYYSHAYSIDPNHVDVLNGLAMTMVYTDQKQKAVQIIDSLAIEHPDNFNVQNSRGIINKHMGAYYINNGNLSRATPYLLSSEIAFDHAIQLKPQQTPWLNNNKALALFYNDKKAEAKALFEDCDMMASNNNSALIDISKGEYRTGLNKLKRMRDNYVRKHNMSVNYLEHNISLAERSSRMMKNYRFISFYFLHEDRPGFTFDDPFDLHSMPPLQLESDVAYNFILEDSDGECKKNKFKKKKNNYEGKRTKGKKSYGGKCPKF